MGNAARLINENSKDRVLTRSLELCIDQFISLAFNNFLNEPFYSVPLESHPHNNKKVGETPTQRFFLSIGFEVG
jgi:hypothetical protein